MLTSLAIGICFDNHCKCILTNYKKQCRILSEDADIHECMSESIGICSGLSKLILAGMFLTEDETRTVKKYLWATLCYLILYFPNQAKIRNLHNL